MGLDNGIIMKLKSEKAKKFFQQFNEENQINWLGENYLDVYEDEIDICYWRKFWGFRNACCAKELLNDGDHRYYNTVEQIQSVYDCLKKYAKKDYWDDNENNSIWDYYEYLHIIYESLGNLKILENLIQEFLRNGFRLRNNKDDNNENVDIEVYMYDSY